MLLAMREAADKGWLFIVDGGLCEFRLRLDKQITIYTIVSAKPGVGSQLLERLFEYGCEHEATFVQAKCPADLPSNAWYEKKGFDLFDVEHTKRSGRKLNVWRLSLAERQSGWSPSLNEMDRRRLSKRPESRSFSHVLAGESPV